MTRHVCESHRAEIEEAAESGSARSPGLSAHLAACPPCEHFLKEGESLRRLVGGLEKVSAPADFEFRLRARMAAAEAARPRLPFRLGFVPGVVSVALAACFLIFSASIYLRRETTNRPAAPSSETAGVPAPSPVRAEKGAPTGSNDAAPKDLADKDKKEGERGDEIAQLPRRVVKTRHTSNVRASFNGKGRGMAESASENVATFEVQPAPILNASSASSPEQASTRTDATPIAVRTPSQPLRVVLRDERGAARVVSMNSVSFGAQELVRQGRNVVPVSYTDKKGVW